MHLPRVPARIIAVFRRNRRLDLTEDTVIESGDEVIALAPGRDVRRVISELRHHEKSIRRIIVGGDIPLALQLAHKLNGPDSRRNYEINILDTDRDLCKKLASEAPKNTLFIEGSIIDEEVLESAGIDRCDLFIALSRHDETNIMAALMLQRTQKIRTIAVIRQFSTQDLRSTGSPIDTIISPRDAIISALLSLILQEGLVKLRIFRHGQAEALELLVQGDPRSSYVIGRKLEDLTLPPGVHFGIALREKMVIKIDQDYVFTSGDHVVVYLTDRTQMRALVKLFKPRPFWVPHWR